MELLHRLMREFGDSLPPFSAFVAAIECCEQITANLPYSQALARVMHATFFCFLDNIPKSYYIDRATFNADYDKDKAGISSMTVPLYDIFPNCGQAITDAVAPVLADKALKQAGLLSQLRKQILTNEADMNGLTLYGVQTSKKPILAPHERSEPPAELCQLYLKDTPFLDLFNTPVPFTIPRALWPSHAFILGPSGWGKSQLLGSILREAVEDPEPRSIIILDPHAQKDKSLFQLARERLPHDRLVVIDPDVNPPDIGLLDYGVLSQHEALDTFKFLMSSLAGGLSPKQATSLPSLFQLLSKIPNASLVTLHEIIKEQPKKGQPLKFADAIARLDGVHRDFFDNLWYSGNYQETKDALQWKLLPALGQPTFEKMFSATRNSIDMDAFLREPKILLISGAENSLGKDGMRIFLLFLVGQYYAAAKRRKAKHLAMCIVDEAWMVLQLRPLTLFGGVVAGS
jgi:uncharacterized protein DUF87